MPEEFIFPIFPVRGSRGCPFRCKYCNFSPGRSFRLKSPDSVSKEIAALADTGKVKMIRFTDDNLFFDRRHLEECCREIIKIEKGIKWTSFIRANSITKENIKLLRDSGCVLAQIGMESGDRKILKEMNKKSSPEDYLESIALLNSHGISTQLYFIIGFPGETPQSIENTIEMINRFDDQGPGINTLMVFPFVFAPLSPIYDPDKAIKYSLKGYMNQWTHYTMDSEQASTYATDFIYKVENIYPHYGIEEFLMVDMAKLKKISRLRNQIFRAQKSKASKGETDQYWQELKNAVTA
jgi:radical SAM superfamily enzyme YgiQ (UPF0313 family)